MEVPASLSGSSIQQHRQTRAVDEGLLIEGQDDGVSGRLRQSLLEGLVSVARAVAGDVDGVVSDGTLDGHDQSRNDSRNRQIALTTR